VPGQPAPATGRAAASNQSPDHEGWLARRTKIEKALEDVDELVRSETASEALNRKVLFETADLRLACAAINPGED